MEYIVNVPSLRLGEKKVFDYGDRVDLSSEVAAKLMKKGYIKFDTTSAKKVVSVKKVKGPIKLIPDGNVDNVKEYISGIEDVELLEKLATEEASDKNRKAVLEAIKEKILGLGENDDGGEGTPNITLNPDDVIVND